jgi:Tfp pilus assembly protein PilV
MQLGLRSKKNSGFTIFEVAIAAAVMALAISSALVVMGRGFASLDSARCISYASQIMQSELEKMRLTRWGDGTAAGNGTTGVTAYPATLTTVPIDTSFITAGDIGSRMTLTRIATDVHTGMIQVTLTITWTTFDRRTMTRTYITYYGKNGLYDFFVA